MKKIVFLCPFAFYPKGTVRARCFPIAKELKNYGYEPILLIPPYDNTEESGKSYVLDNVKIVNINVPNESIFKPFIIVRNLIKEILLLKPDIVYLFKPKGFSGIVYQLFKYLPFKKMEFWLDVDDWEGKGGVNKINPYPFFWKMIFSYQQEKLPFMADIITVASKTLESLLWSRGIEPSKIYYLPNAPLKIENRIKQEKEENYLIYVGYFTYGMALEDIIEAVSLLKKDNIFVNFYIVGKGVMQAELENLAKKLNVENQIKFLGFIKDYEKVKDLIKKSLACVLPYRDNLVNRARCASKIAEYMSMRKLVFASAIGENIEFLGNNRGILVKSSAYDWYEKLKDFLNNPSAYEIYKDNAYKYVKNHLNWQNLVKNFVKNFNLSQ